jgi:hypothetical protein
MQVSRRVFLKYAAALGGLSALNKSGLLTLKHLSIRGRGYANLYGKI